MKKSLVFLGCCLLTIHFVVGQKIDTTANKLLALHNTYAQKGKANNIVGWVMLGSGLAMTISGIAVNLEEGLSNHNTKGLWLSYLGGTTTLASIPFFISGGKYKRKARLALKGTSLSLANKLLYQSNYTALALSIPLGHH